MPMVPSAQLPAPLIEPIQRSVGAAASGFCAAIVVADPEVSPAPP